MTATLLAHVAISVQVRLVSHTLSVDHILSYDMLEGPDLNAARKMPWVARMMAAGAAGAKVGLLVGGVGGSFMVLPMLIDHANSRPMYEVCVEQWGRGLPDEWKETNCTQFKDSE